MTEAELTCAAFHVNCTPETTKNGERVCQSCKRSRPLVLFAREERGRKGLICQLCFSTQNPDRLRQRRVERKQFGGIKAFPINVRRKAQLMWSRARLNAWRKGILFDLTQQWLALKILAGHCAVTGIPFDLLGSGGTARELFGPSLDRKDPTAGYTPENCQVVVWIYNCAKADGTHDDVLRMAKALLEVEAARAELRKGAT